MAGSRPVGPLSEMPSSLLTMTSRSVAANITSWISQNAGHPQADEIASFDQHRSPNMARGLSAGTVGQGELLRVVQGSLGRGMQADGIWAHLPATMGPIAAVPARGCPDTG